MRKLLSFIRPTFITLYNDDTRQYEKLRYYRGRYLVVKSSRQEVF